MKNFRRICLALTICAAFAMPAIAGETQTPPCPDPGEANGPPCTPSAPVTNDEQEISTTTAGYFEGFVSPMLVADLFESIF